ncbi:hypothetical protein BCR42DRAFT_462839 [Absidia repens]|uniref:FHA domain-containing protein n=1 Tax=Absidia repens TaxID=90262 RepID=A0A1X2I3J6_9FUNG|nr:hypothetical protein BCR42DRAFT_462839 [Absidia repens]
MPINPAIISAPASPEPYSSDFGFNSDDIVPTSALDVNDDERQQQSRSNSSEPPSLVIVGSYQQRITLGRGGSSTVKIGRRNRQISRNHVAIEYANGRFELVVLGLNGASVDHLPYRQHERAPLDDHSFVDVLGDSLIFRLPAGPPPQQQQKTHPLPATHNKQPTATDSHLSSTEQIVKRVNHQQLRVLDQNRNETQASSSPQPSQQYMDEIKQEDEKDTLHDHSSGTVKNHASSESTEIREPEKTPIMDTPIKNEEYTHEKDEVDGDGGVDDNDKENNHSSSKQDEKDTTDYAENIIDILVFSRKSSMPISDICSRIIKTNPSYKKQDREVWTKRIQRVLQEKAFFGEIVRKGKTADGSPKEHLYYYNSDMDPVEWRRATYTQVGRSARKCTLQDKQYFWRIPPKLGKNRNAYIPPPAPTSVSLPLQEKRKLDQNMAHEDDDVTVKKQKQ